MATEDDAQPRTAQKIVARDYPLITNALLAGSYFNKYVNFAILLANTTDQYIKRRYSDFLWLRNNLKQRYVGIFIPPLPPKVPIAMWPKGYLQIRKAELQLFLRRCVQIPYLKTDEVVQFWLKNESEKTFEKARKIWDKEHPKISTLDQVELLKTTFPALAESPVSPNFEEECVKQTEYVKEAHARLKAMHDSSKRLVEKYSTLKTVAENMLDALKTNQEGERNFGNVEITAGFQKRLAVLIPEQRVDITEGIQGWTNEWNSDAALMQQHLCSCIKKNMMDMESLKEICDKRDALVKEWTMYKDKAQSWRDREASGPPLKSNEVKKKSFDLNREEQLTALVNILANVSKDQLRRNWQMHARLWSFNTKNFVQGHHEKYQRLSGLWKSVGESTTRTSGDKPFSGAQIKL